MSYPNQLVFTQFHPVTYMVKLNIEMSMASLIAHLASVKGTDGFGPQSHSYPRDHHSHPTQTSRSRNDDVVLGSYPRTSAEGRPSDEEFGKPHDGTAGIPKRVDVEVRIHSPNSTPSTNEDRSNDGSTGRRYSEVDDEVSLTNELDSRQVRVPPATTWDATATSGHPRGTIERKDSKVGSRR